MSTAAPPDQMSSQRPFMTFARRNAIWGYLLVLPAWCC